jgi:hypothetical protein
MAAAVTINELKLAKLRTLTSTPNTSTKTVDDMEKEWMQITLPTMPWLSLNDLRWSYWRSSAYQPLATDSINDLEKNGLAVKLNVLVDINKYTLNELRYKWWSAP